MSNIKAAQKYLKIRSTLLLGLMVGGLVMAAGTGLFGSNVAAEPASYTPDIATRLVTRCDLIKDYLSKTVRINELAARQNKVRGWEYILRHLDSLESSYGKLSIDYSEMSASVASLRQQLDQFKVDFEAYDNEFQNLLGTDCRSNPGQFWKQLETVRSFRAGIALSAETYKNNLAVILAKEESKW